MASVETQTPTCPVCHQSDKVMTMQAAFDSGISRAAPPDMPTKKVNIFMPLLVCIILVGIFTFSVLILFGGSEANLPVPVQFGLVALTLICIVSVLVVSYISFQRVVQGDAEATERFPAWDRAMAVWRSLLYCSRDDVVFDPKTNRVLSNDEVAALRAMEPGKAEQVATSLVQNAQNS